MVGRRRGRRKSELAASPQRAWIWGRNAVVETLATGRWQPNLLRLADRLDPDLAESLEAAAAAAGIPCERHPYEQLTRWCGSTEHQGCLAQMPPFPYDTVDQIIARASSRPLFVLLDRIQDPHNFGAILRSAEVFGADAVLIGSREQCEITPHVARSSAGAVNLIPIGRGDNLVEVVAALKRHCGTRTIAAAADGPVSVDEFDFQQPTTLIIGNEGRGVSPELRAVCDQTIHIPQHGRLDSLNAAVAAGVLLYEARRQRGGATP